MNKFVYVFFGMFASYYEIVRANNKIAIEARKASQMASFDGYGLTQYAMLENSKIELHGNYILYIVSPNDQPVIKAFEDAL